jgi:fluoride exporter
LVKVIVIGCGGFIGAVLRYVLSGVIQNLSHSVSFPVGTLGVNLIGCYLIGIVACLAETHSLFSTEMRLFLLIGILGAFTTYSTFSNETLDILHHRETLLAILNIVFHVILGLLAVWLGRITVFFIWG